MADINPNWGKIPACQHCEQPMRLNSAVSSADFKQYICSCTGSIYYVNVHKGQRPRADRN